MLYTRARVAENWRAMITPLLQDDAFLDDVGRAPADERNIHLWWLGQSGFLVKHGGRFVAIDPYLSDSLTLKYAATDKPHVRMTQRVIDPARLDFVDVISSSHNHTDHLDAETILPILKCNPAARIVAPNANRAFVAQRLGMGAEEIVGVRQGQGSTVAGFAFTGIPAAHPALERDENGDPRFMGYIIEAGGWTIYHSGDTLWHEEIVTELRHHKIDIALLPINGDRPERRVAGNLNGAEAARLAKTIAARIVIPCHYDMFEFNTASPEEFVGECRRLGQGQRVLRAGERFSTTEVRA
jgi:L-ascorbate metabolism protein UlaG (beta-lactamase superfamily)